MKIFLGVPTYDYRPYWHVFDSIGFALHGAPDDWELIPRNRNSSILGHCFNMLYTESYNMGCDVFAMCHADIQAEPSWLYAMVKQLSDEYPVLATVLPIKDDRLMTSTAVGRTLEGNPNRKDIPKERVTYRIPLSEFETDKVYTFDTLPEKIRSQGEFLCMNTGLWVMKLRQPWSHRVYFEMRSWTELMEDGRLACGMLPEDWNFSRLLHILGVKVRVTTGIRAKHIGVKAWDNDPGLTRSQASRYPDPEPGP